MKLVGSKRAVRSPEFHRQKELERKLKLLGIVLVFTALISTPLYFIGSESLQVKNIFVQGNVVTTSTEIESVVRESLRGEYLWFMPKSSTLLLSKEIIEQRLLERVPRFASVHLSREGLGGLLVDVQERVPKALYCAKDCYFLDEDGYIYSEAPNFDGGAYLEYRDGEIENPVGKSFLTKEKFRELNAFVESFRVLRLVPKTIVKDRDVYKVLLEDDVEVRWRAEQGFSKLFVDLNSFLNDKQIKNLRVSELLYLDLSFDNKVYWACKEVGYTCKALTSL